MLDKIIVKLAGTILFLFVILNIAVAQADSKSILNPAKKIFSFGVVTDIQYADAEKTGNRDYRNSLSKLEKCANEFNRHELAFVISIGDMIDHNYISFDKPLAILANLKAPLYNGIGNHDFEVDDQYKGRVRGRLKNERGYFKFEVSDMDFIVLDGCDVSTFASVMGSKQYNTALSKYEGIKAKGLNNAYIWNGGIGDKQIKWLTKVLKRADGLNKKVVIFCHWPLLPENGTQLWNNQEVLSLINSHHAVVAWIAGHHHVGGYEKAGNIHHLTFKGMVEARSETSCGIIDVFSDRLVLKGYGDQSDQTLDIF